MCAYLPEIRSLTLSAWLIYFVVVNEPRGATYSETGSALCKQHASVSSVLNLTHLMCHHPNNSID